MIVGLTALVGGTIFCLYLITGLFSYFHHRYMLKKIPSPPGHWLFGNLPEVVNNDPDHIFSLLRKFSNQFRPIYRFEGFWVTTINLLHPSDIEIVLANMKHLKKSKIYELSIGAWLGEGLLTSSGKKWQTRRKILTPAFHFNILQQFLNVFNEETDKLIKQLETCCEKPFVNVVPYITQMTLQSIGEAAMGLDKIDKKSQEDYKNAIYKIGKLVLTKITKPWFRLPPVYYFSQLRKEETETIKHLHDFAYTVIRSREEKLLNERSSNEYQDIVSYSGRKIVRMLDILLLAKMDGCDIDLEGIREEVDTFMFEGHDTTSVAITFLLLALANNADVQEKVRQEIDDVLGAKTPTYNDLQELRYMEMVIKETLRLYPSVPFISRVASEAFTSDTGYYIPKGTILHIHIFDLHRDPSIYPDPLKFDPDRFLPENSQHRHPFAYIPFSAGPRNCIGQRFAILELKTVLCGILRKFRLHPVDTPEDIKFLPDLVLRTKQGIKIKITPN